MEINETPDIYFYERGEEYCVFVVCSGKYYLCGYAKYFQKKARFLKLL